jgi:SagB-type dehydrogenase family enzyme
MEKERTVESVAYERMMRGVFKLLMEGVDAAPRTPMAEFLKTTPQGLSMTPPPLQKESDPSKRIIDLPKPESIKVKEMDLRDAIEKRRSLRDYSDKPLTLEELSWLLWCTQGVRGINSSRTATLRNVPSGGSRHPIETYLLVNNVDGLQPGLYRFLALEHKLVEVSLDGSLLDEVMRLTWNQLFVRECAVVFFWVGVVSRTAWRYSYGVYRVLLLEAGHVCQNLYLAAEVVDAGACAIGGFVSAELGRLFGLVEDKEIVLYVASLGKKKAIHA